jgi:hypothetical protein
MTRRWPFLLLTLLVLLLVTGVLLGWGGEAVFFVTALLLALTIRHDSRLSAAMGLVFLATCPFLLIAGKDAVAELVATYAFFFLAIGVALQLEELFLERYGWLDRKLDLSYLWRPVAQFLQRGWSKAAAGMARLLAAADRTELVRLVQVVGTAGLAAVFVWAAFSGAPLQIVLPLLGGALLFPFLVWGGRLGLRVLGPVGLLRIVLVLAVLPLAAAELVWLYDLATGERLARMEMAYDLIEHLDDAARTRPAPEGEEIEAQVWTLDGVPRRTLYQHPAYSGTSRVAYSVPIGKGYLLDLAIATAPESWQQPGDGVTFAVYVEAGQGVRQLFSAYIDPKQDVTARRWQPTTLDLGPYAGQTVTITLETGAGLAGDYRYDWAGWGAPRGLKP